MTGKKSDILHIIRTFTLELNMASIGLVEPGLAKIETISKMSSELSNYCYKNNVTVVALR